MKVTNTLNKKDIDNSGLPTYKVRLDASLTQDDWGQPDIVPVEGGGLFGGVQWVPSFIEDAQPKPPIFSFELFDFDFLLTTNLLLPTREVIDFEVNPGARFPRDLYIVGKVKAK